MIGFSVSKNNATDVVQKVNNCIKEFVYILNFAVAVAFFYWSFSTCKFWRFITGPPVVFFEYYWTVAETC
jgi:hypothetical protein